MQSVAHELLKRAAPLHLTELFSALARYRQPEPARAKAAILRKA